MRMCVTPPCTGHGKSSVISQGRCDVFGSTGLGGKLLVFSPLESVRTHSVSINTARWGHCSEHPEEGAAGWQRVGTCRGNCSGRILAQGGQGRQTVQALALTGFLPVSARVSLPQPGPTPLQGWTFKRATDGASQPGSGPLAGALSRAVTQGSG